MTQGLAISERTFQELQQSLDNERLIDLVLTIAFYNAVVRILATLQIDVEDDTRSISTSFRCRRTRARMREVAAPRAGVAMWSRLLALALLLLPATALADVKETVAALAPKALVLVMDADGNELVAQNTDEPFVPASVTKIVTAWLAMEVLGGDYRFKTRFYLDAKRVLYVRGGGDPFLISEELAPLATELVATVGKEPITGIVIDASYYPSNLRVPGIERTGEAYNALNSALAVNFNTINAVRSGNKVRSAEKQTPITPLAIAQFRQRAPNGTGRISLSQDPSGEPAICRRVDRRVHRAGRRQREGQDLDRNRPRGTGAGLRSPAVAAAFRTSSSSCSAPRTTTSPTRSSWRSADTAWAGRSASRSR